MRKLFCIGLTIGLLLPIVFQPVAAHSGSDHFDELGALAAAPLLQGNQTDPARGAGNSIGSGPMPAPSLVDQVANDRLMTIELAGGLKELYPLRAADIEQAFQARSVEPGVLGALTAELSRNPVQPAEGEPAFRGAPYYAGVAAIGQPEARHTWADTIFEDDFGSSQRFNPTIAPASGGTYTVSANPNLRVTSMGPAGSRASGHIFVESPPLGLIRTRTVAIVNEPVYTMETIFVLKSSESNWFRVIDDGRVVLHVDGGTLQIYARSCPSCGPFDSQLAQLTVGNRHQILSEVWPNGKVDVTIVDLDDGDPNVKWYGLDTFDSPIDWVRMGEVNGDYDYGWGEWEYIKVVGATFSRYLETFPENNVRGWRTNADEQATIDAEDGVLSLSSSAQQIADTYTPVIDYQRSGVAADWYVSFDFRILGSSSSWLIVLANDQFLLHVTETTLYYYYKTGCPANCASNSVALSTLTIGAWYYIVLDQRSDDTYDIYVGDTHAASKIGAPFVDDQAVGSRSFRLGDFNANDHGEAEWDHIKVISPTGADGDNDGLSDGFEDYNSQIVWADDFEIYGSGLDDNPRWHGWQFFSDWTHAKPAGPNIIEGYADSDWVIGTVVSGNYGAGRNDVRAVSPPIDLTRVAGNEPLLVYNVWHNLGSGDKCEVGWRQSPAGSFNIKATYTGANSDGSDRWSHVELGIPGAQQKTIEVIFSLSSDTTSPASEGAGCYLDDVSILGQSFSNNSNSDRLSAAQDDLLSDGQEWYYAKTSPFDRDTDEDELSDGAELTDSALGSKTLNSNGRADPLVQDVFFEVDRMAVPGGDPHDLSTTAQSNVIADLWRHGIRVHFRFDTARPTIAHAESDVSGFGGGSCAGLNPPAVFWGNQSVDSQDLPGKYFHVMMLHHDCSENLNVGHNAGRAQPSGDFLGLFLNHLNSVWPDGCWPNHERAQGDTLIHEWGHNAGLADIPVGGGGSWMVQDSCADRDEYRPVDWPLVEFTGLGGNSP